MCTERKGRLKDRQRNCRILISQAKMNRSLHKLGFGVSLGSGSKPRCQAVGNGAAMGGEERAPRHPGILLPTSFLGCCLGTTCRDTTADEDASSVRLRDPSHFLNSCQGEPLDEETQDEWAAGSPSTLQPGLGSSAADVPGDVLSLAQVSADGRRQPFLVSLPQTMVSL